jgi:hypothetical protein
MRAIVHLQIVVLLCVPAFVHAARPFVTDDARIVDDGGYQLESFIKQQRKFNETEFWFLPATNQLGRVELTLGGIWVNSSVNDDTRSLVAQAKTLIKPLEPNGFGLALTVGVLRTSPLESAPAETNPFVNGIASFSIADDAVVIHTNLGARWDDTANKTRKAGGIGAEIRLHERLYGIVETYGEQGQQATRHFGLRVWVVPSRVQVDSTLGFQHADPERKFFTVGLRLLW